MAPELRPSLQSRGSLATEASITVCPHGQQWRQQFRGYGRQMRTHEVRACPTVDHQHVGPIHVDSVGLLSGCCIDILSVSLPPGQHHRLSPLITYFLGADKTARRSGKSESDVGAVKR